MKFRKCRDLGIPVWLAPKVECHHVIDFVLTMRDYRPPANPPVGVDGGRIVEV